MRLLHLIYLTIWFRCHPITGPVAPDDPMPPLYPTLAHAYELARLCVGCVPVKWWGILQ